MSGISSKALTNAPQNKLKYNGKEEQKQEFSDGSGLDWLDYGARMYDAQIGRWLNEDDLSEKVQSWTTYNFALNNPVRFFDPDGMEVQEINGGYRYTGDDAIAAFNFLKNKNENVYIALVYDKETRENTNSAISKANNKQWSLFAVKDFKEAATLTSFLEDKSVKNLVINTHGGTTYAKLPDGSRGEDLFKHFYADVDAFTKDSKISEGDLKNSSSNPNVKYFEQILSKVANGANFVLASCETGKGELGKKMLNTLYEFGGSRFNVLLNMGTNRNTEVYKPPYEKYGVSINGSESYKGSNSWVGIGAKGVFYFKDVFINRDSGTPLVIQN